MTTSTCAVLLCAVLAAARPVAAQGGAAGGHAPAEPPRTGAGAGSTPAATTFRMRGTIQAYNVETGVLSVATATGTVPFTLTPGVRLRRSGHRVDLADLTGLAGRGAAVRYLDSGGLRTVESVNIFEQSERITR